jgi:hypothetical protein
VLLLQFDQLTDPVTSALRKLCVAAGGVHSVVGLRADRGFAHNLSAVQAALPAGAHPLVGVGLAGTLLLGILGAVPLDPALRVLALFPYLGVDSPPYAASHLPSGIAQQCLQAAGRPWLGRVWRHVGVTPRPRGLEGVYPPAVVSWRHAAACLQTVEFAHLLGLVQHPATVVLNQASPQLNPARALVSLRAFNALITPGLADPAAPGLAAQVMDWADGSGAVPGAELSHV